MPKARTSMRKIRDVLRLSQALGLSQRQVAGSVLRLSQALGLSQRQVAGSVQSGLPRIGAPNRCHRLVGPGLVGPARAGPE